MVSFIGVTREKHRHVQVTDTNFIT